jgi:hypothetical protein
MQLMTKEIKTKLLRNGDVTNRGNDHRPVVKFFGGGSATWLITEMDSADDDTLYGLCDLGQGYPELGYVSLTELKNLTFFPPYLSVERDRYFKADKTLSQYYNEAIEAHRIIA